MVILENEFCSPESLAARPLRAMSAMLSWWVPSHQVRDHLPPGRTARIQAAAHDRPAISGRRHRPCAAADPPPTRSGEGRTAKTRWPDTSVHSPTGSACPGLAGRPASGRIPGRRGRRDRRGSLGGLALRLGRGRLLGNATELVGRLFHNGEPPSRNAAPAIPAVHNGESLPDQLGEWTPAEVFGAGLQFNEGKGLFLIHDRNLNHFETLSNKFLTDVLTKSSLCLSRRLDMGRFGGKGPTLREMCKPTGAALARRTSPDAGKVSPQG